MSNYLISFANKEALKDGTIHDVKNKLKVKATDLLRSHFIPSAGEIQDSVTAGDEITLAFETKGFKRHRKLQVLQMVSWYCVYLGLMEAQIHASLPKVA